MVAVATAVFYQRKGEIFVLAFAPASRLTEGGIMRLAD